MPAVSARGPSGPIGAVSHPEPGQMIAAVQPVLVPTDAIVKPVVAQPEPQPEPAAPAPQAEDCARWEDQPFVVGSELQRA